MKKFTLFTTLLTIIAQLAVFPSVAKFPLCTMSASATISSPILCNGGSATVIIAATGGIEPYTGTGMFTVSAGTYYYTITDAAGCSANTSITVTQPDPMIISECGCSRARCKGDTIQKGLTVTGGTPPYSGVGPYILTAGVYTLSVTDANGCTGTINVVVTEPDTFTTTVTTGTIACHGGNTTVNIAATGGTVPYSGTGDYTLPEGSYDFTVYDARGCTSPAHIDLSAPDELTVLASPSPTSCISGTALVAVTADGGTTPYTGVGTFTVSPGVHNFDVTDANGCAASTTIYIDGPPTISANAVAGTINCYHGSALVNVTGSGGASPYTGIGTYTVSAGTYSYTVTDAGGCSASVSATVAEPTQLTVSQTSGSIACHGGTTPVTISAAGGTTPYSGTGIFNYTAGTQFYTVSDGNGCSASGSVTLSEPPTLVINAITGTITTPGGTTTVNISATGGSVPYGGTGIFTVAAGTYTYTVTDANGCSAITSVTIPPADIVSVATAAGSIHCHGGSTTVTVTAVGGIAPYTGIGTYTVSAGTYTYTVTDASGHTSYASLTLTDPPALSVTSIAGNIACHDGTTNVSIGAAGGIPPYAGTGTFTVTAGTHDFIVTDAGGCTHHENIILDQPSEFTATAIATPIICHGGTTTIALTGSGGVAPYAGIGYRTENAGTYSYTITDAHGCKTSTSIAISEPPLLMAAAIAQPILCYGDTSSVSVIATGGTFPYSGIGTYSASVGTHNYTVTDNKGCTSTATIAISQPDDLVAHPSSTSAGCGETANKGAAWVVPSGGTTPYRYQWDAGAGGATTDTAKDLRPGSYTITVTDNNNCTVKIPVTITGGAAELSLKPAITDLKCFDDNSGAIDLEVTGGIRPYHYRWSNGVNTDALSALAAGTYTVTVTDNGECTTNASFTVTQPDPIQAQLESPLYPGGFNVSAYNMYNGSVMCTVNGGTAPYTFAWSNGGVTQNLQDLGAGKYTLRVTDADGCSTLAKVELKQPLPIDVPEGFSPNGDGDNDYFVVRGLDNFPVNDLQIFNRWGNLVYSMENYKNTWDGNNKKGEPLPDGTYYVVLKLENKITRAAYVELRR